jgi:hypothetical protein
VSAKEIIDDQLYQLALGQSGDPFGAESARGLGWHVSRATDDLNNHVVTFSKTVALDDLRDRGPGAMPAAGGKSLRFDLRAMRIESALFTDRYELRTAIPALIPGASSGRSDPWSGLGAIMAGSMIGVHVEVRGPGKLIESNGETAPDGFVSWDLNLQRPTSVRYAYEVIDVTRVAVAVVLAVLLLLLIGALAFQWQRNIRAISGPRT